MKKESSTRETSKPSDFISDLQNNATIFDSRMFFELADFLPETVFIADPKGKVVFVNKTGRQTFRLSPEAIRGDLLPSSFFIPEDCDRLNRSLYLSGKEVQEFTALKKDGSTFAALLRIHRSVGNILPGGIICMITDISERKNLEKALFKSEQKCHDIFKNTWEHYVLCDLDGNFLESNIDYNDEWGISEHDLVGLNLMDFVDEEVRGIFEQNLKEVINNGKFCDTVDVRMKDGDERSYEFNQELVYDGGKPVAIRILAREITDEVRAKKALEISEARYRSVFENKGLPTIILKDNLLILMANARFEKLVGYSKEAIEGKLNLYDLISESERKIVLNYFLDNADKSSFELECRICTREGSLFDMIMQVGSISNTHQKVVSFTDITSRKQTEKKILESSQKLQMENLLLRSSMKERYRFGNIIGKSQVMQKTYENIVNAAETNANVVIYGESGTGKELVAQEIHQLSSRKKNQFIVVNCGAIPENIIESEFFGYKKGAFTGAYTDKPGYLDAADGGTLFLDEVGEINLNMQVKLLRVIDNGDYTPLGSNVSKKTNVRIIAATNRNLQELIKKGLIREDFFYRIHIIPVHLPPLRKRKEDIPLLIDHYLKQHGVAEKNMNRIQIDQFLAYDWPGNVRELQNAVHRFVSMKKLDFGDSHGTEQKILQEQIPKMEGENLYDILALYEKEVIENTLTKFQWHRGRAAKALGINRKTLFTKATKFGLKNPHETVE